MASNELCILQTNIQSLYKNKAELHRVVTGSIYTAAILSETWTQSELEKTNKYYVSGFHFIPDSTDDGYGGTGLLLSNKWNYVKLSKPITSRLTQVVSIHILHLDIVVSSVYVSPTITAMDFEKNVQSIFLNLQNHRRVIIGGDFNAHHISWGDAINDRKGEILMDTINQSSLLILNDGSPTYLPLRLDCRASTIDITLCSSCFVNTMEWIALDNSIGSHHRCLRINWTTQSKIRSGCFYDEKEISKRIAALSGEEVLSVGDLQRNVRRIYKESKKKDVRTPKFWWSNEVDAAWKEKNETPKNFNRVASMGNLLEVKKKAAMFQRKKREEIKKKFEELPEEVGPFTTSKELWMKVGRLTGKRSTKRENNIIFDDLAAAENFLDTHFGSNDVQIEYTTGLFSTSTLLDIESWNRILSSKRGRSAPGEDNLTYEMLRCLQPEATTSIIRDINDMWQRGCLSDNLKNIKVVAIPKPGRDQNSPNGRRPISLVPTLTKIANTAVLDRLKEILERDKVLPKNSFGFRKGLSTNTCVSFVTNWIKESKRSNLVTALICIDLSNAFNAVRTERLEEILSSVGVPQDILMWISSFLKNRSVSLQTRDKKISRTISNGLPQGDVLSPTLFNVYTLKLHQIEKDGVVLVQYADDFGILVKARSLDQLNKTAQEYLQEFT